MIKIVEVTKEQFNEELNLRKQYIQETCYMFEPPITFYWDKKYDDMSFGKCSFAALEETYDFEKKEYKYKYYLEGEKHGNNNEL